MWLISNEIITFPTKDDQGYLEKFILMINKLTYNKQYRITSTYSTDLMSNWKNQLLLNLKS